MASRTLTTNPAVATSLRTTYTTPLLAAIQTGTTIQASHMNSIAAFINSIPSHTHQLTDYTKVDEYGNTGKTVYTWNTTSAAVGFSEISWADVVSGDSITAAQTNTLIAGANDARVHNHTWDDTPS
jgi:hypothetical protein